MARDGEGGYGPRAVQWEYCCHDCGDLFQVYVERESCREPVRCCGCMTRRFESHARGGYRKPTVAKELAWVQEWVRV